MAVCHDGPFLRGCANKKARRPYAGGLTFMYEYLSCHNFVLARAGLLLTLSRASRPFPSLSGAFLFGPLSGRSGSFGLPAQCPFLF